MKFLVLISICYARPNSNEKTLEKSNCKNIIQVSDTTEESHSNVDYKIEHFPKFYRFNFNFKINSLNLDAPTRFTHGLRNILHSSTVSDTNSHCSQHQAGRLPSLFAYINHQSEFEYLYVELCVGHELQTMFIKPKDFSFEMGKWNSFNIEQTMSKTVVTVNDNTVTVKTKPIPFNYQSVNIWVPSDLWYELYEWPTVDASITQMTLCNGHTNSVNTV